MITHNPYTNLTDDDIEINHIIHDKFGDAYTIKGHLSVVGLLSYVYSEKHCVGRINWTTSQEGVMTIEDLIIFDWFPKKPLWARIFPFLYTPPNYRGRRLGDAMLKFIIESARSMGLSEIRGWVTDEDLKATPYLLEFYRKHRFTVNDNLTFYQVLD